MGLRLDDEERADLEAVLVGEKYDRSVAARARIVLLFGEGRRKSEIASILGTSRPTVDKWLERYVALGVDGLTSRRSPGKPRVIPGRIRAKVLALTRTSPPSELGISQWSSSEMAKYIKLTEGVYVSQTWVSRVWRENGLRPWRQGTFKISRDPEFEEKVRDVVGLYRDPPPGEVVVSIDAKTGIQALDRTQPLLPVTFCKTEKRTHDYRRMGTVDMYAAMDLGTGKVALSLSSTHNTRDFLGLARKVVSEHDGKKVHFVLDNASPHLSEETKKWLADQNGNVVFHFTPTGASWLNMIEIWNGIITRGLIRRGTFVSVKALTRAIKDFAAHWNVTARPFQWTATADDILDKVRGITSQMCRLERATEITDVTGRAA